MWKWYERWFDNPKAKVIANSIRNNPEDWKPRLEPDYGVFTLDNGALRIWVANGCRYVCIYKPYREYLGLIGRERVWRAYKRMKRNRSEEGAIANAKEIARLKGEAQ